MIQVTKLNGRDRFWINENLIETMDETPDTILSLANGKKIPVAEPAAELAERINRNWMAARPAAAILAQKLMDEK